MYNVLQKYVSTPFSPSPTTCYVYNRARIFFFFRFYFMCRLNATFGIIISYVDVFFKLLLF